MPGEAARHPVAAPSPGRDAHLLELLREERLVLLVLRRPPLALARSLCARLFWVLALPPLLAAWARVERLEDGDDLEEEEELRDAIACSFGQLVNGRTCSCGGPLVNLGRPSAEPVGTHSASA